MLSNEIESLLHPITAEGPFGIDLEHSAVAELDRLAQGKPEQQIGNTVVAAEAPDWKAVQRKSLEILSRSKDLRAATQLAKALLQTDGWAGLAQGLLVLANNVEQYWDGLYPLLDPDDDNDPTMRVNIIMDLVEPAVLKVVRATPLISSRTLGRFALRDIDTASEGAPSDSNGGAAALTMASIEAAAMDCDLEDLRSTALAVKNCGERLTALETALATHVEAARAPSFTKLAALVRKADIFLSATVAKRVPAAQVTAEPHRLRKGLASVHDVGGAAVTVSGVAFTGAIRSREDVIRTLDAIIAYYEKNEPSSPIPIFMARSKRLVMMGFVDIVRELVPDALSTVDVLRGPVE